MQELLSKKIEQMLFDRIKQETIKSCSEQAKNLVIERIQQRLAEKQKQLNNNKDSNGINTIDKGPKVKLTNKTEKANDIVTLPETQKIVKNDEIQNDIKTNIKKEENDYDSFFDNIESTEIESKSPKSNIEVEKKEEAKNSFTNINSSSNLDIVSGTNNSEDESYAKSSPKQKPQTVIQIKEKSILEDVSLLSDKSKSSRLENSNKKEQSDFDSFSYSANSSNINNRRINENSNINKESYLSDTFIQKKQEQPVYRTMAHSYPSFCNRNHSEQRKNRSNDPDQTVIVSNITLYKKPEIYNQKESTHIKRVSVVKVERILVDKKGREIRCPKPYKEREVHSMQPIGRNKTDITKSPVDQKRNYIAIEKREKEVDISTRPSVETNKKVIEESYYNKNNNPEINLSKENNKTIKIEQKMDDKNHNSIVIESTSQSLSLVENPQCPPAATGVSPKTITEKTPKNETSSFVKKTFEEENKKIEQENSLININKDKIINSIKADDNINDKNNPQNLINENQYTIDLEEITDQNNITDENNKEGTNNKITTISNKSEPSIDDTKKFEPTVDLLALNDNKDSQKKLSTNNMDEVKKEVSSTTSSSNEKNNEYNIFNVEKTVKQEKQKEISDNKEGITTPMNKSIKNDENDNSPIDRTISNKAEGQKNIMTTPLIDIVSAIAKESPIPGKYVPEKKNHRVNSSTIQDTPIQKKPNMENFNEWNRLERGQIWPHYDSKSAVKLMKKGRGIGPVYAFEQDQEMPIRDYDYQNISLNDFVNSLLKDKSIHPVMYDSDYYSTEISSTDTLSRTNKNKINSSDTKTSSETVEENSKNITRSEGEITNIVYYERYVDDVSSKEIDKIIEESTLEEGEIPRSLLSQNKMLDKYRQKMAPYFASEKISKNLDNVIYKNKNESESDLITHSQLMDSYGKSGGYWKNNRKDRWLSDFKIFGINYSISPNSSTINDSSNKSDYSSNGNSERQKKEESNMTLTLNDSFYRDYPFIAPNKKGNEKHNLNKHTNKESLDMDDTNKQNISISAGEIPDAVLLKKLENFDFNGNESFSVGEIYSNKIFI